MAIIIQATEAKLNPIVVKSTIVPKTINAASSSCAPVTIIDQDLSVVTTVASGGTYPVISFNGIDGGTPSTTYSNSIVGGTP